VYKSYACLQFIIVSFLAAKKRILLSPGSFETWSRIYISEGFI